MYFLENEQWDWEEVSQKQIIKNLSDYDEVIDAQSWEEEVAL